MRLTTIILIASLMQVSAATFGQKLTLQQNNIPLKQVFKEIRKQTGYDILYQPEKVNENQKVKAAFKDTPISEVLDQLLQGQSLQYAIKDKTIVITQKESSFLDKIIDRFDNIDVHGKVMDEKGEPLVGATVTVIGGVSTKTDQNGEFHLQGIDEKSRIKISYVGFNEVDTKVKKEMNIHMILVSSDLKEVTINKGYYTENRKLSTGNIGSIRTEEIQKQPVANPLQSLIGRVAGVDITQGSGIPGAPLKVQVRGQGSLIYGSDPLFVIDGVPFANNNSNINNFSSIASQSGFYPVVGAGAAQQVNQARGGISPFNSINPSDIESIEILKDADATAIYGSRGGNGVVLITTKKGTAGKTKLSVNVYSGISEVAKFQPLLNTQQYLEMRKEAFKNDGVTPVSVPGSPAYAPDLTLWSQNRYTDFQKLLIGGTANTTDANATLSGGGANTQFLINTGFNYGTTVFPSDMNNSRYSLSAKVNNRSSDGKFRADLSSSFSSNKNSLFAGDLSGILLAPNAPDLYNQDGTLRWQENGVDFVNPLAQFLKTYTLNTDNFNTNLLLSYSILNNLSIRNSIGYNAIFTDEKSLNPLISQNPNLSSSIGEANFGKNAYKALIVEPQIDYKYTYGKSKLSALIGGSYQYNSQNSLVIQASGYQNDAFIASLGAAPIITSRSNNLNEYKYAALYGRVNYNYDDKYLLNVTGRRDGSSRFGPDKRFSNFGAIGAAWLFADESIVKRNLPFLSTGKIRGSYGISGNDQIGDYKFLDTYTNSGVQPFQGKTSIRPSGLFNPDYVWEKTTEFEAALELGFLEDRHYLTLAYFNRRSGNQLVSYQLASQTGFSSITRNLDALIENAGFELNLSSELIKTDKLSWSWNFNLSIPQNKLLKFPDLSTSSYSNNYVVGESINSIYVRKSLGVDQATGTYTFEDLDHSGYVDELDNQIIGRLNPKYFGGIGTSLKYGAFQFSVFADFKKQMGRNYLNFIALNNFAPGLPYNQSVIVLDRWQNPGDITSVQKFTASTSSSAYSLNNINGLGMSSAAFSDASFLRLKNIFIGYDISSLLPRSVHLQKAQIFLQGQNLLTITGYKGGDPETQSLLSLPALRTVTAGLQINL